LCDGERANKQEKAKEKERNDFCFNQLEKNKKYIYFTTEMRLTLNPPCKDLNFFFVEKSAKISQFYPTKKYKTTF
jgi:hypothetical protein